MGRYKEATRVQTNSLPEPVRHFLVLYCHDDIANIHCLLGVYSRSLREKIRKRVKYTQETQFVRPSIYREWFVAATDYFSAISATTRQSSAAIARKSLSFVEPEDTMSSANGSAAAESNANGSTSRNNTPNGGGRRNANANSSVTGRKLLNVIVTHYHKSEMKQNGVVKTDYVSVKYRHVSLADCFLKKVSHSVSPDGLTFFLKLPTVDDETSRKVEADDEDGEEVDNEVMAQIRAEMGDEYVAALSEQITNSSEFDNIPISIGPRPCFPMPVREKQINMVVHTGTGTVDMNGDPAMHAYMIIDSIWEFQVMNSERFVKRYAPPSADGSLAAALQQLGIGGN